jgi:hypothetical protein
MLCVGRLLAGAIATRLPAGPTHRGMPGAVLRQQVRDATAQFALADGSASVHRADSNAGWAFQPQHGGCDCCFCCHRCCYPGARQAAFRLWSLDGDVTA